MPLYDCADLLEKHAWLTKGYYGKAKQLTTNYVYTSHAPPNTILNAHKRKRNQLHAGKNCHEYNRRVCEVGG